MISGFRREVDEECALLCHYAANGGNLLPTFRDNLSVLPSRARVKNMGPIRCSETSVINYHYSLRSDPEVQSSHLIILRLIVWVTDVKWTTLWREGGTNDECNLLFQPLKIQDMSLGSGFLQCNEYCIRVTYKNEKDQCSYQYAKVHPSVFVIQCSLAGRIFGLMKRRPKYYFR